MHSRVSVAAFAGALLLACGSANAAYIAYVSPAGTDSGDCSVSACRQIGYAVSQIGDGGTILVAPGEYAAFEVGVGIDKQLDVIAPDGQAVINAGSLAVPGGGLAAIVVQGRSGLRPTRISGFTLNVGASGVAVVGDGPRVIIENCFIYSSLGGVAVDFRPSAGAPTLIIRNTQIMRYPASGGGIRLRGAVGSSVTIDDVEVNSTSTGITIDGTATTGINKVVIRNSTSVASDTYGLYVIDSGGGSTSVKIENSEFSNNTNQGIVASGANVAVRVANSSIANNNRGLQPAAGSQIISQGGNVLAGNTVDGAFTATLPFK